MIPLVLLLLFLLPAALAQTPSPQKAAIHQVKKLYDAGQWQQVVRAVPRSADEAAEMELYRGLALAHLGRLDRAERTFRTGLAGHPRNARFLEELAGIAYRRKQYARAVAYLRRALAIDPRDAYAENFLGSIYFLEGNLEAALKYWNRVGKPQLNDLAYEPVPHLDPLLLDRAFVFSPGSVWSRQRFVMTQAELESLDLFPGLGYDLVAQPDGPFQLVVRAAQRSDWRHMRWQSLISALRGLPYQSVYPEFYNLNDKGLNWLSFVRWDAQKRMLLSEIATPLFQQPDKRLRIYFDGRNENWNISNTLVPLHPSFAAVNVQHGVLGAGLRSIASWRWQWGLNAEYSYRDFRTLVGIPAQAAPFFTRASGVALRYGIERSLVRYPERRFTLDSSATGEFGKFFASPLGRYGRIEGSAKANWFPQASGEDYGTQTWLRAGRTFGQIPFDDLFMLGFDRDNELWMRGHNGLHNGQKGNAPLGSNFILSNSDIEKIVRNDGIFLVKVGPFLDTGDIYDPTGFFGSPKWLTDTGLQTTVRVLGRFEFVLGYGRDLRFGGNTFYSTVSR
ncbi:MAG: tetratricopeptide repeat protein [Acidobacteriaceae bacterium]